MTVVKENYLVKKRNILNEIRSNNMTLQELRFFSIYLSKINPNDINTRVVRFPIDNFRAIMDLGRINIDYMKTVTNSLLSKVVNVPTERGGYTGFQLFKECTVDVDDRGEWYIEIDAHDKALPLLFEFKEKYFSYQLWNALQLKSTNQLRMYEILKQYERIGSRVLSIKDIRNLLGIAEKEYKAYKDFRIRVIDACQQALLENTDICFTYEPYGKRGRGGKILALKFTIKKNEKFVDQLTLEEFIEQNDDGYIYPEIVNETLSFYAEACDNEFDESQIQVLYDLIIKIPPYGDTDTTDTERFDYLRTKYHQMVMKKPRSNRFGYLKKIISVDFDSLVGSPNN